MDPFNFTQTGCPIFLSVSPFRSKRVLPNSEGYILGSGNKFKALNPTHEMMKNHFIDGYQKAYSLIENPIIV